MNDVRFPNAKWPYACAHSYTPATDRNTAETVLLCTNCGHTADEVMERSMPIVDAINPKDLIGRTKPGLGNVPPGPLYEVARAFDDGARKYGAFNWREKSVLADVYHDACQRHLECWFHGRDRADDSKVHHLAHAIACLMILLDAEQQKTLGDNRPHHNVPLDDILTDIANQMKEHLEAQK